MDQTYIDQKPFNTQQQIMAGENWENNITTVPAVLDPQMRKPFFILQIVFIQNTLSKGNAPLQNLAEYI